MQKRIIDAHYHNCEWTINDLVFTDAMARYQKECNIDAVNVLCLPKYKGESSLYNIAQNILGAILKLENDTVYSYAGLFYPSVPLNDTLAEEFKFKKQAEYFIAMGFDGMKMLESKPTMHKVLSYGVDKKGYEEFFSYLEENSIPLNSHVNDPYTFWNRDAVPELFLEKGWFYGDGTYASMDEIYGEIYNVLDKHPKLKVILPHGFFMGHRLHDLAEVMDKYPNVMIDLAPGPAFFTAASTNYEEFKSFFNKYYKRILFGTDANNYSPFSLTKKLASDVLRFFSTSDEYTAFEYYDSTCTLRGLGLDEEKVNCICCDNFLSFNPNTPKKIDKAMLKKYIEEFLPYMDDCDTKQSIVKYCKEKL